ncbi:MAG: bifunctional serine/threonine-protein kinase/formylglycine-generating enzyme family protein [Luteolibacter sp.]
MMLSKNRPHPQIPDHEVLRKIGGGAYGEVWLARGVTGALRAVKVVWREDFEDERTFEREFQGILKFEPISRDHPGLVHILHVGRCPDGSSFYYYVMELGDDVTAGQDINPIEYEPRTLRADHKQTQGHRWDTNECIDVGVRLAEALGHLHEKGLAHRDIKPANIIFVNGRAKLADIGLVATRGQRTFVGTEGFVPPEGPGSEEADVYSLGKVLYEIATGKDRLDFPTLPEDLPEGGERKRWLELNKIICEICDPRISRRTISTANELADALRRLQKGQRRRFRKRSVWITAGVLTMFFLGLAWVSLKDTEIGKKTTHAAEHLTAPAEGKYRIQSYPEGAEVVNERDEVIGYTPTPDLVGKVGDSLKFTVRKNRFLPSQIRGKIDKKAVNEPQIFYAELKNFSPPEIGEDWTDQFGGKYRPRGKEHVCEYMVPRAIWQQFLGEDKKRENVFEYAKIRVDQKTGEYVIADNDSMQRFCEWMTKGALEGGYLSEDFECRPDPEDQQVYQTSEQARELGLKPFRVVVRQIPYGSICVISDTPGAEVFMHNESQGTIQDRLVIPKIKPGTADLVVVAEGYRPTSVSVNVDELKETRVTISLEKNQGVVFSKPWENGIKMKFVPLGDDLMVSIWETRLRDYKQFIKDGGRSIYIGPDFPQTADHPVVNVKRQDAIDFCEWLTKREQKEERIATSHQYRLPTDAEWSLMVGLVEEKNTTPAWRDARKARIFPWGDDWPPRNQTGNFADSAAGSSGIDAERLIPGYQDGFSHTSPVGSFPPNSLGIYDLAGNAQEWVSDDYAKTGNTVLGVLRGGGWNTFQEQNLYSGNRNAVPVNIGDSIYGFRIVLSKIPQK